MTKIIATIGPSSDSEELIKKLILNGVNIFRFNMKHNVKEWHVERINRVNTVAKELRLNIGILIDLQGPEIRIETFEAKDIEVNTDDTIVFCSDFDSGALKKLDVSYRKIRVSHPLVCETLKRGDRFSIDNGMVEFIVESAGENYFIAKSRDTGIINTRKGLNLLGVDIALPSLIDEDLDKLDVATLAKVDFIALSFVRTPEDVMTLKQEMSQRTISAKIISKVESQKGVDNIDAIIDASDGIMIARGDLGVEVPLEQVTHIQKEIIKKCRSKCKPVIVATQMLESMIDRPRPTRAEAADVANAVYDGTDAVMLSGESATGKYPVKAVEVMRKILKYNEGRTHSLDISIIKAVDYTQSIVSAAMNILNTEKFHEIHKIIVFTETGYTARVLSSFRPNIPVVALSNNLNTVESLSLNYGIVSFYYDFPEGFFSIPAELSIDLKKRGIVKENETVIILHGSKWRDPGKTNALLITRI